MFDLNDDILPVNELHTRHVTEPHLYMRLTSDLSCSVFLTCLRTHIAFTD